MKTDKILLPSVYLGTTQWYSKLIADKSLVIDQHEHYIKQTWRNRARIVGANGIQDLVIPVHAPNHTAMKEVMINYSEDWQRQHWQSIRSAYGNAPFFEYYADYFAPFYSSKKSDLLIDFNTELLKLTFRLLKLTKEIFFSESFIAENSDQTDLRILISPKKNPADDPEFISSEYMQVFNERHGFIPNVSIIDLLCCEGPAATEIILKSRKIKL
ncbi:WbqC family protein [soil metagenome]